MSMSNPATSAECLEWHTQLVDEMERRVIALALAVDRPDLATPIMRPTGV